MSTQSEQALEDNLIAQLVDMGCERVGIGDGGENTHGRTVFAAKC